MQGALDPIVANSRAVECEVDSILVPPIDADDVRVVADYLKLAGDGLSAIFDRPQVGIAGITATNSASLKNNHTTCQITLDRFDWPRSEELPVGKECVST